MRPVHTRRVLVDMTPLEAGGQNGGAGLVATSLVRNLAHLAPEQELVLLTAEASHGELAALDAPNVRRLCVRHAATHPGQWRAGLRRALDALPAGVRVRTRDALWRLRHADQRAQLGQALEADLLFCPFTVPYFWRPGVRLVSVVHDLQELSYPRFFSPDQRQFRRRHLREACARADRIVCVSEYVRRTLLASVPVAPERVVTIHHALLHEPAAAGADPGVCRVPDGPYVLYPANFWPHKNHRTLFEALRRHRARRPSSRLRLVCTGAPGPAMRALQAAAEPEQVIFAGYVAPAQLEALFRSCLGVVVPSLYEGFGMPVLEGMAHEKPVLCSNVTSLPEVAGDAAVYFDPLDAEQIASALGRLEDEPVAMAGLAARGRARAASFGTARDLAARYLDVFDAVLAERVA